VELIEMINERYASLETLTVGRLQVKFTGGSIAKGYLKKYPTGKGHLVIKRPNWILVTILNPVTNSTVITMASDSREFQIWVPRQNKYLTGKTTATTESEDPMHSIRPAHLLPALMIAPLGKDSVEVLEESREGQTEFYVIHSIHMKQGGGCLSRKIWIERNEFNLTRQQYFDCGQLKSDIKYSGVVQLEAGSIGLSIILERISEHYTIAFTFEPDSIRVNRTVEESLFSVKKPRKAEVVVLGDKDLDP
jgi:outer membrane lipoprotein-sorting protein